ncbi:uncharacterized protein [Ptychodera flava]|uniref:uncharacterized protein isoform X2 n=1 Tax=Ptychodera flava TaxID=63121 RepID=UPI00396A3514
MQDFLVVLFLPGVCLVIYSISFIWAVSFRFLWGLLNGNIAVAKTYLSEICDDSNVAKGFSIFGTAGAIARLTSPAVAGFLSCAAIKYRCLDTPVLRDFPYLLPCLVGAGLCVCTLLGAYFYLKETLQRSQTPSQSDSGIGSTSVSDSSRESFDDNCVSRDTDRLLGNHSAINDAKDDVHAVKVRHALCCTCCLCCCRYRYGRVNATYGDNGTCCRKSSCGICDIFSPLKDRRVFLAVLIQSLLAFCSATQSEILPLLLVTNYRHGGYDFDTTEISLLYSMMAVPETVYQILIYPKIVKLFGLKRAMQIGFVLCACFLALIPSVNRMTGPITSHNVTTSTNTHIFHATGNDARAVDDFSIQANESNTSDAHFQELKFVSSDENVRSSHAKYGDEIDAMQNVHKTYEMRKTAFHGRKASLSNANAGIPWTNITSNLIKQCKLLSGGKNDKPVPLKRIPVRVWAILLLIVTGSTMARMTAFVSSTIIIGNSCLPKDKGTVYGVAQSMTAAFRSLGPPAGGNFFAWTEDNGLPWPLDYHLTFYLLFVLLNVGCGICFLLPNSINKKRQDDDAEDNNANQQVAA